MGVKITADEMRRLFALDIGLTKKSIQTLTRHGVNHLLAGCPGDSEPNDTAPLGHSNGSAPDLNGTSSAAPQPEPAQPAAFNMPPHNAPPINAPAGEADPEPLRAAPPSAPINPPEETSHAMPPELQNGRPCEPAMSPAVQGNGTALAPNPAPKRRDVTDVLRDAYVRILNAEEKPTPIFHEPTPTPPKIDTVPRENGHGTAPGRSRRSAAIDFDAWVERARSVPIASIAPQGLKRRGKELIGPCPRCKGTDRFSIHPAKGVFNCRGCGNSGDIIALARFLWDCDFNTAVERLNREPKPGNPNGKDHACAAKIASATDEPIIDWENPQAIFDYTDRDNSVIYQNARYPIVNADGTPVISPKGKPDKTFRLRRREGTRWVPGLGEVAQIPYKLADLAASLEADRTISVFIPEGEAKVNILVGWNLTATHIAAGTKNYAELFHDADVVLVPDNDDPGYAHINEIGSALFGIARRVRVLVLPGLDKGQDVIDWAAAGGTAEQFWSLAEAAPDWVRAEPPKDGEHADQPRDHAKSKSHGDAGIGKDRQEKPCDLDSAAASEFEMRAIQWFWPNRFALGKLGLIGGLPDRGKGLILSHMIAKTTTGGEWPCNEGRAIQGNVLLATAEDDIEDTIIPRLVAAGADLTRLHIVKMVSQDGGKRMFSLVSDLELLRRKIDEIGDVVMIVIDPISAYLGIGKIDSHRATDVRGVLSPLTDLAAEKRLLIIGIMHFNKKADVHNAMLRIADSLAYVAAARHCYVVTTIPRTIGGCSSRRRTISPLTWRPYPIPSTPSQ